MSGVTATQTSIRVMRIDTLAGKEAARTRRFGAQGSYQVQLTDSYSGQGTPCTLDTLPMPFATNFWMRFPS